MSERMKAIASLVTPGYSVADIGCDHGYISIFLVQENIAPFCIAADVRKGPAEAAAKNIVLYGVQERVEVRLGNGLEPVEAGETDCAVIAGMGGKTILSILSEQPEKAGALKEMVLGPQSEIPEVRQYITEHGFSITEEKMVFEDGKYYPLIRAAASDKNQNLSEEEQMFGPVLLKRKDPVLQSMLQKRVLVLSGILEGLSGNEGVRAERRKKELEQELIRIKDTLASYYE